MSRSNKRIEHPLFSKELKELIDHTDLCLCINNGDRYSDGWIVMVGSVYNVAEITDGLNCGDYNRELTLYYQDLEWYPIGLGNTIEEALTMLNQRVIQYKDIPILSYAVEVAGKVHGCGNSGFIPPPNKAKDLMKLTMDDLIEIREKYDQTKKQ